MKFAVDRYLVLEIKSLLSDEGYEYCLSGTEISVDSSVADNVCDLLERESIDFDIIEE